MVWFINCNSLLGFFLSCYIGDLTWVQIKSTAASVSGHDRLVVHKIFATMERKYSSWLFISVGGGWINIVHIFIFWRLWFCEHVLIKKYIASWIYLFIPIAILLSSSISMSMPSKVFLPLVITKSPKCFDMASMIILLTLGLTWYTLLASKYQQIVHFFSSFFYFQCIGHMDWWQTLILLKCSHKGHTKVYPIQCIHIEPP